MIRACRAELIKLSHRPVVLVLTLFATASTIFGYLAQYAGSRAMAATSTIGGPGISLLLPRHLVENVLVQLFDGGPPDGAIVGIVLGAMVVGSEYGWGTVKTTLVQGPSRSVILAGQIVALLATLGLLIVLDFAAAGAGSLIVARLAHVTIRLPAAREIVGGILSIWLILGAWASLGVLLATIGRGAAVAMGVGIAWEAGIAATIKPFAAHSGFFYWLVQGLPKANTDAVVTSLTPVFAANGPPQPPVINPTHGMWVLAGYLVGAVIVAFVIFRRRDVA